MFRRRASCCATASGAQQVCLLQVGAGGLPPSAHYIVTSAASGPFKWINLITSSFLCSVAIFCCSLWSPANLQIQTNCLRDGAVVLALASSAAMWMQSLQIPRSRIFMHIYAHACLLFLAGSSMFWTWVCRIHRPAASTGFILASVSVELLEGIMLDEMVTPNPQRLLHSSRNRRTIFITVLSAWI